MLAVVVTSFFSFFLVFSFPKECGHKLGCFFRMKKIEKTLGRDLQKNIQGEKQALLDFLEAKKRALREAAAQQEEAEAPAGTP